ncbi:hypothetical protein Landi51_11433 [Colletotrichum acutatum]
MWWSQNTSKSPSGEIPAPSTHWRSMNRRGERTNSSKLVNADNAIFRATVALGLLLEDMHNWPISWPVPRTAPPTERTAMALRHYQIALQQLFVPLIVKDSANVISLASAGVFSCIETLCGNAHNAMKLTSLETSILTQLEVPSSSPANSESLAPFVSVFVRLDSYMKGVRNAESLVSDSAGKSLTIEQLLQTEDHVQPKPPPFRHMRPCPSVFSNLREANRHLETLENLCLFAVEQQGGPRDVQSVQTRTSCQSLYQEWPKAFNASSISTDDGNSLTLLHIRRLHVFLTLHGPEDTGHQSDWDYFLPEFIEMLTYAASAVAMQFFDFYLKDEDNGWQPNPRVRLAVLDPGSEDTLDRVVADWPVPGLQSKALYLYSNNSLSESSLSNEATLKYNSSLASGVTLDYRVPETMEVTGYSKLRLWVSSPDSTDMDISISVQKLSTNGTAFPSTGSESSSTIGPTDALPVSHRELDIKRSTDLEPFLLHTSERLLSPGEIVPVDIPL